MTVTDEGVIYNGKLITHLEALQEIALMLQSLKQYANDDKVKFTPKFLRQQTQYLVDIEFSLKEEEE